jgi:hypothetical protein
MAFNVLLWTQVILDESLLVLWKTMKYFFSTFVLKILKINPLIIHCGYVEIETIVPLSFLNHTNEYKVVNNHIV